MSAEVQAFLDRTGLKALHVQTEAESIIGAGFGLKNLIENFEVLEQAAGALSNLRRLVLSLAVRGRLSTRQPGDGAADILLTQIAAKHDVSGKPAAGHTVDQASGPFALPQSWRWARFLAVASIDSHLVDPAVFPDLPHVAPDNIEKGTGRLLQYRTIREDGVTSSKHRFFAGQLIYSKIRPNLSKVVLVDFDGLCSADMYPLTAKINRKFLQIFILSQGFLDQVVREDNRLAMPKVNQEQLGATLVPVPPLEEQKRIVARVDQLMALCDDLEARHTTKREIGVRLTKSALEALATAEGREDFDAAWNRVVENFSTIVDGAGKVTELRRAVLDLAVRGRLIGQASVATPIGESSVPSRLPPGWRWTLGRDVFSFVTSGSRGWAAHYSDDGPMFLRIGNLDYGGIELDLRTVQRVQPPENAEGTRTRVVAGDILVSITGDTGMVGLVPPDIGEAYINQHIALCRPGASVMPEFVARALTAPSLLGRLQSAQRGIKNSLGLDDLRNLLLPVPPLEQQKRILLEVHRLSVLCDDLEAKLRQAEARAAEFVKAAVQELVRGAPVR